MTQPYLGWKSFSLPEFHTGLLKSEEINICKGKQGNGRELSGSDLASFEAQSRELQTLAAFQHKCQPTGLQAGFQATAKPPEELLCFISSMGICLIGFTGWCLPEWQAWVWVAAVRWIKHVPLPELISFLLRLIYLGWHYDTQLVLMLEMFSGLEISV